MIPQFNYCFFFSPVVTAHTGNCFPTYKSFTLRSESKIQSNPYFFFKHSGKMLKHLRSSTVIKFIAICDQLNLFTKIQNECIIDVYRVGLQQPKQCQLSWVFATAVTKFHLTHSCWDLTLVAEHLLFLKAALVSIHSLEVFLFHKPRD